jgi:1-aminocyclopropane-1-carboxylate deaminase/D-cysteine desulfhydrase-like pyridoxal-dependent ACC family enzyme
VEIIKEIEMDFDYIITSCGTGSTLAGIISGLEGRAHTIGFPVLKGGKYLKSDIMTMIKKFVDRIYLNWHLETNYHFGGYAKYSQYLIDFINSFKKDHGIQLDPVYTGKMMFGIYDLIKKNYFQKGTRIVALHTGGLQGIAGFNERFGNLIKE